MRTQRHRGQEKLISHQPLESTAGTHYTAC